ncbi:polysaccharide deacetylase family protein [Shouchella lonarensis]|uniref:Peptidoglycan/xylan/chitin deacetylase, PgdA/CDA1 family n=1 Tax=Shouchella lonarensis TaxID=1464122 RepID=A0A1G6HDR8_9BACI|nr:polysaccharide deacetylase family protein [Shouchella lonarensis]SDB92361.1 Peptidoglycan/xylan/chitin deacetylase, PgdA/CDA1 family [Shouchella lonarensis]
MKFRALTLLLLGSLIVTSCNTDHKQSTQPEETKEVKHTTTTGKIEHLFLRAEDIDLTPFNDEPSEWGETVTGVKTKLATTDQVIALTFDACGGEYGSDVDEVLLDFLLDEQIPATLFVNERWIDHNYERFLALAADPLFQIENHGTAHKPLSVTGQSEWGITGTASITEAFFEVAQNHNRIVSETGRAPTAFRSGTAYYDDVSVKMVTSLGLNVVNYNVLGDAGATYSAAQVQEALRDATPGSIALLHMNQPKSGTAEGVKAAVSLLKERGFSFVLLADYPLE